MTIFPTFTSRQLPLAFHDAQAAQNIPDEYALLGSGVDFAEIYAFSVQLFAFLWSVWYFQLPDENRIGCSAGIWSDSVLTL